MTRRTLPPASLCTAALLAGCATPTTVFEGRDAMRDGGHRATVDRTVSDADLPPLLRPDCSGSTATPAPREGVTQAGAERVGVGRVGVAWRG